MPVNLDLLCIDVGQVHKPPSCDLPEQIIPYEYLELETLIRLHVQISPEQRAQSRYFDLRETGKGFVKSIKDQPDSNSHFVNGFIDKCQRVVAVDDGLAVDLVRLNTTELDFRHYYRHPVFCHGHRDLGRLWLEKPLYEVRELREDGRCGRIVIP